MKKLINDPDNVLKEQLQGFQKAHEDLVKVHFDPTFITRSTKNKERESGADIRWWQRA